MKCLKKYGGLKSNSSNNNSTEDMSTEDLVNTINVNDIQYTKMFRDIKINTMQYTEDKLRKMCSRYLLLDPEQRVAAWNKNEESTQKKESKKNEHTCGGEKQV